MKLFNQFKSKRYKKYWAVHEQGKKHVRRRPYIIPILGLVLGILIVVGVVSAHGGQTLKPSDSHVVFLFDRGKQQTLDTKAETVGDLLDKLPINLVPEDVVEPSKDTRIYEDNFRINIYRSRPVTVVDNGVKTVTITARRSPRSVAQQAGLNVAPEDLATFERGNLQENIIGEKVVVNRATPIVLNLYGNEVPSLTQASTVNGVLREKHIKLENGETVTPGLTTAVTPNMKLFVLSKGSQVVTTEEAIAVPVQTVDDATLSFGATAVRQAGAPGKKLNTYLINTENGKETSRKLLQEVIVQAPVPQIVARGSTIDIDSSRQKVMAAAGISAGDFGAVNYIVSRESNWHPASLNAIGCAGLGQACPGSKLAAVCPNWQSDPVCQLRYFSGYASKFGGWGGAYAYWQSHGYW